VEEISVKDLVIQPIPSRRASAFVKKHHYSGKVVSSSWLHLGVFGNGILGGVMSFGTPIDKRHTIKIVRNTAWRGMWELNRMAFADWLPRNSESRALAVAFRIIKREYPEIEWILSFSDGCQCGDGTIYRASGFHLLRVRKNLTQWVLEDGTVLAQKTATNAGYLASGRVQLADLKKQGRAELMEGFMLMYIKPLNDSVVGRLTIDPLPYSEIDRLGAGMYKGDRKPRKHCGDAPPIQGGESGSIPTARLQPETDGEHGAATR